MKNIFYIIFIILLFFALFAFLGKKEEVGVVYQNKTFKPVDIKKNQMIDPQCKMYIQSNKHAAEVILDDKKTYFFDDVGCMILWLKNLDKNVKYYAYVYTEDTNRWIDAKKACYKIGIDTPMHYGFGAFEKKQKDCISFEELKLKMYRGETLANPLIRKKYLPQGN